MSIVRTLHLIRHGNYAHKPVPRGTHLSPKAAALQRDGGLTHTGQEQAQYTAQRLLHSTIHLLHASTLPRALETAQIISKHLGDDVPLSTTEDLWECLPYLPNHFKDEVMAKLSKEEIDHGAESARNAFERYFHPPNADDSTEVIVCHGNLIRYFVTRVLRIEAAAWTRMRTHHCGITTVRIQSNGQMSLVSYNDTGHLPPPMVTA